MNAKNFHHFHSFLSLLLTTRKYRVFYQSTESRLALLLATLFGIYICHLSTTTIFIAAINNIIPSLILGMFLLLSILMLGLALLCKLFANDVVIRIDKDHKTNSLTSILFSFYFAAVIVAIALVMLFFTTLAMTSYTFMSFNMLFACTIIISYLVLFSIIYTVSLFGTCINAFFLTISIESKKDDE